MKDASETADLRKEVETLRERLAQSSNELQDFLYIVSHDFRGPLRAIMSASMILIEDYGDSLNAEAKAELKRQSEAAKKLNRLLEDLLKLSRLNRQQLRLQSTDLGILAKKIVEEKGADPLVLVLEGDLVANVDRDLMESVLESLIDNSLKFAIPSTGARMVFGQDQEGFYFTDQGIGLDSERANRIFLPFERLNGEQYPGQGMGLATAKRIVNRHEGSITAKGEPGMGVTIRFTLGA